MSQCIESETDNQLRASHARRSVENNPHLVRRAESSPVPVRDSVSSRAIAAELPRSFRGVADRESD